MRVLKRGNIEYLEVELDDVDPEYDGKVRYIQMDEIKILSDVGENVMRIVIQYSTLDNNVFRVKGSTKEFFSL